MQLGRFWPIYKPDTLRKQLSDYGKILLGGTSLNPHRENNQNI